MIQQSQTKYINMLLQDASSHAEFAPNIAGTLMPHTRTQGNVCRIMQEYCLDTMHMCLL